MKSAGKSEYKTGRDDIDKIIADLAKACHPDNNVDLVEEMLITIAKLGIESNDRVTLLKKLLLKKKNLIFYMKMKLTIIL